MSGGSGAGTNLPRVPERVIERLLDRNPLPLLGLG